jgi:hypothetical protein
MPTKPESESKRKCRRDGWIRFTVGTLERDEHQLPRRLTRTGESYYCNCNTALTTRFFTNMLLQELQNLRQDQDVGQLKIYVINLMCVAAGSSLLVR